MAKAINQLFNTNDNKERENIQACLDNICKYFVLKLNFVIEK